MTGRRPAATDGDGHGTTAIGDARGAHHRTSDAGTRDPTGPVRAAGDVVDVVDEPATAPPSVPDAAPFAPPVVAPQPEGGTVTAPGAFTWEVGLRVEVGAPTAVTSSETTCCPTGGSDGVAFTVRIGNDTGEVVEPYTLLAALTADGIAPS